MKYLRETFSMIIWKQKEITIDVLALEGRTLCTIEENVDKIMLAVFIGSILYGFQW